MTTKIWMPKFLLHIFYFFLAFFGSKNHSFSQDIAEFEMKNHSKKKSLEKSNVTNNYDLIYDRCEWIIDPNILYIKGKVTTYFIPKSNSFNQIQFDLSKDLNVDSVIYHGNQMVFIHSDIDLLEIDLNITVPLNTIDSISIYYQGIPENGEEKVFYQSQHEGNPIIWTLSEPYGSKEWWPTKQSLNDKIDSLDVFVTCPSNFTVAGNGILIEETVDGFGKLTHWKTKIPIAAYLVAIAVTNYQKFSNFVVHPSTTYEVLNYVYPESYTDAQLQIPEILNIMHLFDSLTILYPFHEEKYGHAQFGWGGGMEQQTMSFMGNFNFGLMAHEAAHQWFGDYITCGTWEDIWLNEGFATFMEGIAQQKYHPENWENWKINKILNITSKPDGTVFCDDTASVSRIFSSRLTYNKGAYLLHMLRWKLGDSLFFKSVQNYLNDPTLKLNYAYTEQLIEHFEETSGQDLSIFFDQWFYKQGFPSYHLKWEVTDEKKLKIELNQTTSDPSVSFFEMPVPIKVIGESSDTTFIFDHQYSGQVKEFDLNMKIKDIQFDPEHWILSNFNTVIGSHTDFKNLNSLQIFPNPTSDYIKITSSNSSILIKNIQIIDEKGKEILKLENVFLEKGIIPINIKNLTSGNYIINIKTDYENIDFKLVKY